MEVANAKIHSSTERNLEGNLILMVLGFVGITCYCRRNKQRPKRSRVIPRAVTLRRHLSLLRVRVSRG